MRRKARTDANQRDVVERLRQYPGISVYPTHAVGAGFPDLCVGFRGRTYLFELKDPKRKPSERRLTGDQKSFFQRWSGHCAKVESEDEILAEIGYAHQGHAGRDARTGAGRQRSHRPG